MLMGEWGARWVRSQLAPEDLDVTLLMWDMPRTVRPEHFPARRIVVAFEFKDVLQSKRRWWLLRRAMRPTCASPTRVMKSTCSSLPTCAP
jgi:hypothetical protein